MDPVGHTIKSDFPGAKPQLIVGVVKDSKYFTLGEKQRLAVYDPYFMGEEPANLQFLIRTSGSPSGYVKSIDDILGRLDSTAAMETKPMTQALGLALEQRAIETDRGQQESEYPHGSQHQRARTARQQFCLAPHPGDWAQGGAGCDAWGCLADRRQAQFGAGGKRVIGVLGAVAALATLAPAIRALRVDPMAALRYE
jgi:hypothetical protein